MNTKYIDLINQTYEFPQEEFDLRGTQLEFHGIDLMQLVAQYGAPLKFTYLPRISENIQGSQQKGERIMASTHCCCYRQEVRNSSS